LSPSHHPSPLSARGEGGVKERERKKKRRKRKKKRKKESGKKSHV
jgi:hypothetical protein